MSLIRQSPLRTMILERQVDAFNALAVEQRPDLTNLDLRGLDLRGFSLNSADLRGAYLRSSDLRGLDLSDADLDGASIHGARISGVLFPRSISVEEIRLSHSLGTRMRAKD